MAVRLQEPVPRSLKPLQFDARLDLAKLLDKIVAVFASRQRLYIRSDSASQIDEPFFKCRAVVGRTALHDLSPVQQRSLATMEWPRRWGWSSAGASLGGTSLVRPAAFSCNPITSSLIALFSFAHF
jgi:hypothetical protein